MSKRIAAVLIIFAVVALAGYVYATSHSGSWTGEVIDVACYSTKAAKGAGHADCGSKCVKSGLPVGLLVENTTYLLVSADHKPLNATLAEHVGHQVTVTGEKFESAGANVITVKDWKMASAAK